MGPHHVTNNDSPVSACDLAMDAYGRAVSVSQPLSATHLERLSATFSPRTLRLLASEEVNAGTTALKPLADIDSVPADSSLGEAFDAAYALLLRHRRSEYVYKAQLVNKLVFGRHSPRTAAALLEMPMGSSCADLMVLNGTSTIYEVKTDLDQFARLGSQLHDYSSRAEYVYVVVSEARARAAEERAPENVGVLALRRSGALATVRDAQSNLPNLDVDHLFHLLRSIEVQSVLTRAGLASPDADAPVDWAVSRERFNTLQVELAHAETIRQLRQRAQSSATLASQEGFPHSLRALAYATTLSGRGRDRLSRRLSQPMARLSQSD